jgi:hypothetical protein
MTTIGAVRSGEALDASATGGQATPSVHDGMNGRCLRRERDPELDRAARVDAELDSGVAEPRGPRDDLVCARIQLDGLIRRSAQRLSIHGQREPAESAFCSRRGGVGSARDRLGSASIRSVPPRRPTGPAGDAAVTVASVPEGRRAPHGPEATPTRVACVTAPPAATCGSAPLASQ